jgi:hypothetical protein
MHRITASFLLVALVVVGCGEPEPEGPPGPEPLDAVQVMKKPFDPPPGGRLTEELLDRYLSVLEGQRAILVENGTEEILDQDPKTLGKNERTARDKRLATARTRAMMELGIAKSEFDWVRRRIVKARIAANKKPDPSSPDGQEVALLKSFEEEYGREL